jgi:hypothetical protein
MKLLGLIRTLTFNSSALDSLLILFFCFSQIQTRVRFCCLNSLTITDSNKLERVQRKFAALCHKRFFHNVEYHYDIILEKLNLQTLHIRRRHVDALFLINAFCGGTKHCPSVLETVGLRVPTRNIRNFTTFSCLFSHCPSVRCVSAANAVCNSIDIFSKSCLN